MVMDDGSRLAVIDLGSNSFRLVVYALERSATGMRFWHRSDEIYEPVRIAEGMSSSGELQPEPIDRALGALEVFAHFCAASGLRGQEIDAVATAAIREARNREQFLAVAEQRSGLSVRVLTGAQEAHYGYLAAVNTTTLAEGCVLELGGGSVQIARVAKRRLARASSWPLGAVNLTERFLPERGPVRAQSLQRLRKHLHSELGKELSGCSGGRLVGLGGAVRNIADALARRAQVATASIQGALIAPLQLGGLIEELAALPASERARVPGIKPARGDVILAGAIVLEAALELSQADALEATEAGLREGIFFERMLEGGQPLLGDVRRSAVMNLAARYGAEGPHAEHVAKLALSAQDQLAALGIHAADSQERELLWAAAMLHDIGMAVDYDDHHRHSRYLILHAGLPGFSQTELALIAQCVRYHRKDTPAPGPFRALFGKRERALLLRLVALLRLAEDLERARDQAVEELVLRQSPQGIVLELSGQGALAVQRWAAAREGELFARAFGPRLIVASPRPLAIDRC
jgi:exopolyphosphatase/guanosine-5'-triphosphate,3'-diphosphate pyrophosphatase